MPGVLNGIGKETVKRFLKEKAQVCVIDAYEEALRSLKEELNSGLLSTIKTDISDEAKCW